MKLHILIFFILGSILFSCQKNHEVEAIAPGLVGKWRMIAVKDKLTGVLSTKPVAINGEIEIVFSFTADTSGKINGHTPTNTVTADFKIGRNRSIQISAIAATKIMETSWGLEFLQHITFSQDYIFVTNRMLHIHKKDKTLIFQKL